MENINGGRLWCRTTEEKIITAWLKGKSQKISMRDSVLCYSDTRKVYRLWNTDLISTDGKDVYIYIASNMEERDRYWQPNGFSTWQPREYIISNTTKSRLNAFLSYYGFNSLEVHSSVKDWSVKYNGELLVVDCWYRLDFENKKLELKKE